MKNVKREAEAQAEKSHLPEVSGTAQLVFWPGKSVT